MTVNTTTYLRTQDAAQILGFSKATLEKFRLTGGGPKFYKLGRAVRYTHTDLIEWAEARVRTSTSDDGVDH